MENLNLCRKWIFDDRVVGVIWEKFERNYKNKKEDRNTFETGKRKSQQRNTKHYEILNGHFRIEIIVTEIKIS